MNDGELRSKSRPNDPFLTMTNSHCMAIACSTVILIAVGSVSLLHRIPALVSIFMGRNGDWRPSFGVVGWGGLANLDPVANRPGGASNQLGQFGIVQPPLFIGDRRFGGGWFRGFRW